MNSSDGIYTPNLAMLMMPSDLSWGKQYFVLILVYSEPDSVFKEIKITDEQKKVLIESISKKMAP
jgi:hypothetical protein